MRNPFKTFHNADLTIKREETEETFRGEEVVGMATVLACRCDAQESGSTLQQARDVYETGDVVAFPEDVITTVEPGDKAEIVTDDNRTLEGRVDEVMLISNALLISL